MGAPKGGEEGEGGEERGGEEGEKLSPIRVQEPRVKRNYGNLWEKVVCNKREHNITTILYLIYKRVVGLYRL
jgi:hypothetical protein